ncbi:hypothetical protein ACIPVB_06540 [Microbacterium sp. NPDC090007]|uniref:hypothetical protein n=1 Tax=Microbacterium sp. NPDC090007 TaxID=3364204 RepID=UPI00381F13E6
MTDELAAWTRVLEDFERQLAAPDDEPPGAFDAPTGPVPTELVERARLVRERQRASISALHAARENLARELRALRRIPTTASETPIYLDLDA